MPSATSYYSQKTVTTKTTTTKTLPKYEVRLRNMPSQQQPAPVAEPRAIKSSATYQQNYDLSSRNESRGGNNQAVVLNTLAALAKDCNETAEILRSRSSSRSNLVDEGRQSRLIYNLREEDNNMINRPKSTQLVSEVYEKAATRRSATPPPKEYYASKKILTGSVKVLPEPEKKQLHQELQYTLRLHSPIYRAEPPSVDFSPQQKLILDERTPSLEKVCQDFNLDKPIQQRSISRPRSETPSSRRFILDDQKEQEAPICAACQNHVYGPCITALAPNSKRGAQKYHPHHFVCTYCLKPLNLKGTYREHDSKPYCHECFYRLFSGHIYVTENKISLDI